jgi:nitrogen regulatory protein PII
MKMILFVLHDIKKLQDLLDAWQEAGVGGATVLASTGIGRIHQASALRDDLPVMPSLSDFFKQEDNLSRTLFSVVKDDATVQKVRAATKRVIGDLSRPDSGLFVVLPVELADGLEKKRN